MSVYGLNQPRRGNITTVYSLKDVDQRHVSKQNVDIVLSSGFLAFASHAGFLQAVEDANVPIRGVMGTSSGALTGSMFCAGYSAREIANEFKRMKPIRRVALSSEPWKGVFSLDPVVKDLQELLPPSFEDLKIKFGCGVVRTKAFGIRHEIKDSGSLAHAVAASAAVPVMFCPIQIPESKGVDYIDGGISCRIGLNLWRKYNGDETLALVHLIGRSSPFSGNDSVGDLDDSTELFISPKSGASLWDLSGFDEQFDQSYQRAFPRLEDLVARLQSK